MKYSNLLWNLYLQSSAATMSMSSIYLDFLSKPETRTLKAGNMRLKHWGYHVRELRLCSSPVVEFVTVIVGGDYVQQQYVFRLQVQTWHPELHLGEHLSEIRNCATWYREISGKRVSSRSSGVECDIFNRIGLYKEFIEKLSLLFTAVKNT